MAALSRARFNEEADAALAGLARADTELARAGVTRHSLDPARERARSLDEIGRALLPRLEALPSGAAGELAAGLLTTVSAIRTHFPENLFWDLDHLAASILREAAREPDHAVAHLRGAFAEVAELHALFGCGTTIRFRYVHDFVYGFDWAKWVRRDPSPRRAVGPFDVAFLRSMTARGHELLALIDADDPTYPRLRGEGARNPFRFSREPDAELALFRDLARNDLLPVRAWTRDEPPVWDRAFADEREARARALGFSTGDASR